MEVRDLHVQYPGGRDGPARAVDGVDLDVYEGETLALVGESGCGKTTLARAIMGLHRPDVRRDPLPRRAARLRPRRHARAPPPGADDLPGSDRRPERAPDALRGGGRGPPRSRGSGATRRRSWPRRSSRAGLRPPESFFTRYPYEISGGQRQRVIIAGAMVLNPSLLVADEPVSALDASVRGEILSLMLGLVRQAGVTVFVVTHDLGLAWNVADRVAVMYLGRIVEDAPAEQLLTDAAPPVHARAPVRGAGDEAHGAAGPRAARPRTPRASRPGCRFHPRCPVVESGEAARLGIEERCRGEDPRFLPACHAVRLASGDEHEAYLHER